MEHIHDCTSCTGNCHSCGGCGEPAQNAGHLQETQLATETIYDGRILRVTNDTVRLENGKTAPREVIHHPGGACIVPLTDSLEVLMVRQFRYPHNEITLEIPAGKLEYGEDPKTCAIRELKEEVGATAAQVYSLGCLYPTPAYDKEVIHMYLATGLQFAEQTPDEDEFLDVYTIPLADLVKDVMEGTLSDAKTQVCILKAARILGV